MKLKYKTLLKLSPLAVPFIFIFMSGIVLTAFQSFGLMFFGYNYEDNLFAYKSLFTEKWFYHSFALTLFVAVSSSLLSVICGVLISYNIWRLPDSMKRFGIVSKIPLILPHIAVGFLVILLFSRSGIFSSASTAVGLTSGIEDFPGILYSRYGLDIILANIYKETPFVIVMVYAVLLKTDNRLIQTASMLGASPVRIFFRIILPALMPIINTVFIIIFVYNFGSFEIPYVLGSSKPGLLSMRVYDYFFMKDLSLRPVAMAILMVIFAFSMSFVYIYSRVISKIDIRDRKL
jgi:putative spermidine/putrescine transport system permease protein